LISGITNVDTLSESGGHKKSRQKDAGEILHTEGEK
jgi:hypothetical protein